MAFVCDRVFGPLVLLMVLVSMGMAPGAQAQFLDPEDVYDSVKGLEKALPVYAPVAHINMGTFDARNGAFRGLTAKVRFEPGDRPGRPQRVEITPRRRINAVHVDLTFDFRGNADVDGMLTVNGNQHPVGAGRSRLTVDVRRARTVRWEIRAGAHRIADVLILDRPHVIGAGAFEVQALPIAVIYEPPQPADPTKRNIATHTREREIGTRITTSLSGDSSDSRFSTTPEFEDASTMSRGLRGLGSLVDKLTGEDKTGEAIAGVLRAMGGAVGKAERTTTTVNTREIADALEVSFREGRACTTGTRGGPGVGDVIAFLRRAWLVWRDDGRRTTLTFLGAESLDCAPVKELQKRLARLEAGSGKTCLGDGTSERSGTIRHRRSCRRRLSADMIRTLLSLDPFVAGGPGAALPPDRFKKCTPGIGIYPGAPVDWKYTTSTTAEDRQVASTLEVVTDDLGRSLAAIVGVGPSETKRVTTTLRTTSGTMFRRHGVVSSRIVIEGPPPGTDLIEVYYDRLFGTYALRAGPPGVRATRPFAVRAADPVTVGC